MGLASRHTMGLRLAQKVLNLQKVKASDSTQNEGLALRFIGAEVLGQNGPSSLQNVLMSLQDRDIVNALALIKSIPSSDEDEELYNDLVHHIETYLNVREIYPGVRRDDQEIEGISG